jgi:hypothetical protein
MKICLNKSISFKATIGHVKATGGISGQQTENYVKTELSEALNQESPVGYIPSYNN